MMMMMMMIKVSDTCFSEPSFTKLYTICRMIRRVHMPEYNPSLLGGIGKEVPTVVYMTFFPNDEIQKFFPGFDGTLSIQYHELKIINIVRSYTMPWRNISNLTK